MLTTRRDVCSSVLFVMFATFRKSPVLKLLYVNYISVNSSTHVKHCRWIYVLFFFFFFSKIGRTDTGIGKMQIYIVDCFRLTFDRTFYIKREFGFLFLIV